MTRAFVVQKQLSKLSELNPFQVNEKTNLPNYLLNKGLMGTIVNQGCTSVNGSSHEITMIDSKKILTCYHCPHILHMQIQSTHPSLYHTNTVLGSHYRVQ